MRDDEVLTHRLRNLLTVVQGAADANRGEDYQLISEASRAAVSVLGELERLLEERVSGPDAAKPLGSQTLGASKSQLS